MPNGMIGGLAYHQRDPRSDHLSHGALSRLTRTILRFAKWYGKPFSTRELPKIDGFTQEQVVNRCWHLAHQDGLLVHVEEGQGRKKAAIYRLRGCV